MLHANDVASVILSRSGPWTDAMKLQKLLYYVQAWHLAVTDEPLFPEQIKAWKDGPVVPQVWHERKERETRRTAAQKVEHIEVDALTSDLIDLVIGVYGSMSGEELSALTHVELPWKEARRGLESDAPSNVVIPQESMSTFYRANRLLGGRTAADLAAGGIYFRPIGRTTEPIDVDAIFDSLGETLDDPGEDAWGGANVLDPSIVDDVEIEQAATRTYAGA